MIIIITEISASKAKNTFRFLYDIWFMGCTATPFVCGEVLRRKLVLTLTSLYLPRGTQ